MLFLTRNHVCIAIALCIEGHHAHGTSRDGHVAVHHELKLILEPIERMIRRPGRVHGRQDLGKIRHTTARLGKLGIRSLDQLGEGA